MHGQAIAAYPADRLVRQGLADLSRARRGGRPACRAREVGISRRGRMRAIEKGDVMGFLGPNGAGKSTTMKMLTGFLRPTSGAAFIAGADVEERPLYCKRALGYLPAGRSAEHTS